MNKVKLILTIVLVSILGVLCVSNVSAADTITVDKVWNVNGVNFRNTTSGDPAYCMHKPKSGPTKGTKLTLKSTHKKGPYVYILNDTKIAGSGLTNKSRTIRQKALWKYRGYSIDGSYTSEANKLVSAAKKAGSSYEINPTITSVTTPKMTKSGNYYTSQKITVKSKDTTNKYTVSFSGAPKGTEVFSKSGNTFKVRVPVSSVTKNTSFKVTVKAPKSKWYYIKQYHKNDNMQDLAIPYSESKTPSKTVNTSVTYKVCHVTDGIYYGKNGTVVSEDKYYEECNPKCELKDGVYYNKAGKPVSEDEYNADCNPKCELKDGVYYNNVGKPVSEDEFNEECNPKCELKDGVYYNKIGKPVSEDEFNEECNPKCELKDGVYYNKIGKPVSEDEFNKDCNPKCELKDGVYYNKIGKPVSEDEFNEECNPKCKIVNGKYYNKIGKLVTKDEYYEECNPKCEIKDNIYYGAKGNIVTEDVYNAECNPKCKIVDNTYFGKYGAKVTKEEYNKECNPSCAIVDNVYYGKNNDVVSKSDYEKQCVTTKKIIVPNSGLVKKSAGMIVGLSMMVGATWFALRGRINR